MDSGKEKFTTLQRVNNKGLRNAYLGQHLLLRYVRCAPQNPYITSSEYNYKVHEIMLRSSFLSSPSFNCKHYNLVRLTFGKLNTGVALRSLSTSCSPARLHQRWSSRSLLPLLSSRSIVCFGRPINSSTLRLLSTSGSNTNKKSDQSDAKKSTSTSKDGDGKQESSDSNEIVLTPGETVVAVSRLTMWAGIAVFATACAYYIAMELIPT